MAVPKKKTSKSRIKKRRANQKINAGAFSKCPQCKSLIRPHTACQVCGYYKGKQALDVEKREKRKERKVEREKETEGPQQ